MRRYAVLLKDVHIVCDMTDGWQKFLRQEYVPVMLPVHFDTCLGEHEPVQSNLETATETMTDLLKVGRVRRRRSVKISRFFVPVSA